MTKERGTTNYSFMEKEEIIQKLENALQERPEEFSLLLNKGYSIKKRIIDKSNFDAGTVATFIPIVSGPSANKLFEELKGKHGYQQVFPLGSNILNRFLINDNVLYRLTDMWSNSSDSINIWHLGQDSPFHTIGTQVLAKASLSEFKDLGYDRFQSEKKSYMASLASYYILFKSKGANEEFTNKIDIVISGSTIPLINVSNRGQKKLKGHRLF